MGCICNGWCWIHFIFICICVIKPLEIVLGLWKHVDGDLFHSENKCFSSWNKWFHWDLWILICYISYCPGLCCTQCFSSMKKKNPTSYVNLLQYHLTLAADLSREPKGLSFLFPCFLVLKLFPSNMKHLLKSHKPCSSLGNSIKYKRKELLVSEIFESPCSFSAFSNLGNKVWADTPTVWPTS